MTTRSQQQRQQPDVKVGDTIEIPKKAPSAMVRLPDGSVVTTRGSFTVRQPGEHVIFTTDKRGKMTETKVNVAFVGDKLDQGDK